MIKLVELFGGIGAVRKALERENIEFESVGYVEIDKNACKSYNALYNENYSPMSVCDYHLPDEQIDLLVHGSPCFTADTLVLTRDSGYKKITDVNCDDFVLTHDNRYKRVTNFLEQGKKGIYRINAMGFDESDFEKAQALYPQRYIGGKECMCGILYRQAGNSIVVQVLQAIVRELKQYF